MGLLAFVADYVDGAAGQIMVALTSSGFAWSLAAFLAGRYAPTARRAAAVGASLLVLATAVYYLLILVVSRRWSGGYSSDIGWADLPGLRSVGVMTSLWMVGSLVAGPILGLLGHAVRASAARPAAAGLGVACGLLSAEGWHAFVRTPPWRLLTVDDPFFGGAVVADMVRVVLPLLVLAWVATELRLWRPWPTLLTATAAATAAGAALWEAVDLVRRSGGFGFV
ncbi:DUF6518 family protein [Actinoplanes sp. TRM 88003]|uniref:DUF6518 family protein n=1 Tax=Paractinoplanes aksuensis TaxID=2939490 RepID=A0ABT1DTL1_9ACTN|nr:DUF6518 family protein [Actinoplanes aksuensis]